MATLYTPQETRVQPAMTGANAQGVNFTPVIGQGISQLGNAGEKLASDMYRIQEHQKEADATAWVSKTVSDGWLEWKKYSEDAKTKAAPNGEGYTPQLIGAFDKWVDVTLPAAPTERAKKMLASQLGSMRTNLGESAINWEGAQRRIYRMDQIDQSITQNSALIQKDPSLYETLLNDQLASVNEISGELHPEDKLRLNQKVRSMFSEAASLGQVQQNPRASEASLLGTKPLPQGSVQAKIVAEAKSRGIDPQAALAIASMESNYNPEAKNPRSSAHGVYQLIDESWQQYAGDMPRGDIDSQVKAGLNYIADTQKSLKQALHRDPTPGELYMGHLFGQAGVQAILKSPDSMPIEQAVAKYAPNSVDKIVNNNGMQGQTVGQVKAMWAHTVASHYDKAAAFASAPSEGEQSSGNPAFDALTPQGREAMLTHAQTLVKKDEMEARAGMEGRIKDTVAAYQAGEAASNPPTLPEMVKAYGTQGIEKFRELNQWQEFGANVAKVKTATPQEQMALYNASKPSGEGFAGAAERHEALGRAISYVNEQRKADPVAYDQTQGTQTTKPLDMSDPNLFTGPMAARFIQADQVAQNFGTPYKPFSNDEAKALGQFIDQAPAAQAMNYLMSLKSASDNPDHYRAALSQLAPNHPVLAVAGQIAGKQLPGQPDIAAIIIAGDRILNPSKEDKSMEGKSVKIPLPPDSGALGFRDAWERQVGQAYGSNFKSYEQDFQAAKAYYVGAQKPGERKEQLDSALWKKAVDYVAPKAMQGGAWSLVPYGTDPTKFSDTVNSVWPDTMRSHGLNPEDYPSAAFQLAAVDDGVYAIRSGATTLFGSNGQPVLLNLRDVQPSKGIQEPMMLHALQKPAIDRRFR